MAKSQNRSSRAATQKSSLERGLSLSLAGARAGGAIAVGKLRKRFGMQSSDEQDSELLRQQAEHFVAELGKLKGSYVKIGQLFAQFGEHFLPRELTNALHELGSQTEPLEWSLIEPQLQQALGGRFDDLNIEPIAFAAASLAQVHRAKVKGTDETLCLKVLYPGLRETIDSDFDTVVRMLKLGRLLPFNRDLDCWLERMREQLHLETDYSRECIKTLEMTELVSSLSSGDNNALPAALAVPTVIERFTVGDVLALEYMTGLTVNAPDVLALSQRRRNALAKTMLELFFAEVFVWGLIQTDPNFGNYLIQPSNRLRGEHAEPDRLVLLDFGACTDPDDNMATYLGDAVAAGLARDKQTLQQALVDLGCLQADSAEAAKESFADLCIAILEPLWPADQLPETCLNERGQYRWKESRLMSRAAKQANKASLSIHFELPSAEFTLIARKLIGVFTFISVLGAEFNGHEIAQRYIAQSKQGPKQAGKNGR
ncbi:MAG: ABC1 kinase family protein [Pseudomonadales bacterium]